MVARYKPKALTSTEEGQDFPYNLKPGREKTGGRKKGTPNKVPGELLTAIIEACALVGYDREVFTYTSTKKGTLIPKVDESKRVLGLIPYLKRTAELHRKEMIAILGKIVTPAVVQLVMNHNQVVDNSVHVNPSVKDLEKELASMGVSVSLFHGDAGRMPVVINHED